MCPSVYFHLEQWTRRVQGHQCCVDFRLGQILASFLHSCPLYQLRQALIVSYQNINWCGKWLKRVDILTLFYPKTFCSQSRLHFHGLDLKRWHLDEAPEVTNEETTEAGGTTEYEYYETYDTTDTTDYPTGSTATSDYPATRPSGGGGSIKNYRKKN